MTSSAALTVRDDFLLNDIKQHFGHTPSDHITYRIDILTTPARLTHLTSNKMNGIPDVRMTFVYDPIDSSLASIEISRSSRAIAGRVTDQVNVAQNPELRRAWQNLLIELFSRKLDRVLTFQEPRPRGVRRAEPLPPTRLSSLRSPFSPEVGSLLFALEQDASPLSSTRDLKLWELRPTEHLSGEVHTGSRLLLSHRGVRVQGWALTGFERRDDGVTPGVLVAIDSNQGLWRVELDVDGRNGRGRWTRLGSHFARIEGTISDRSVYAIDTSGGLYEVSREGALLSIPIDLPIQNVYRTVDGEAVLLTQAGSLLRLGGETLSPLHLPNPESVLDLLVTGDAIWVAFSDTKTLKRFDLSSGRESHSYSFEARLDTQSTEGGTLQILDIVEDRVYVRVGEELLRITRPTFGRSLSSRIVEPAFFGEDLRKFGILYQLHNQVSVRQPRGVPRDGERIGGIEYRSSGSNDPSRGSTPGVLEVVWPTPHPFRIAGQLAAAEGSFVTRDIHHLSIDRVVSPIDEITSSRKSSVAAPQENSSPLPARILSDRSFRSNYLCELAFSRNYEDRDDS